MSRRALGLLLAFFSLILPTFADTLPDLNPAVVKGQLSNGIRYFILQNEKPENRVEMRLVVRAGSVLEKDTERGLAHLVEHLQFEGTEHFGPQEIVQFLETNGMKFGNDLNAQTGFNDTQYFLDLPADQPEALTKGLKILEDWAHGPRVEPALLEKEKLIVAEEDRVRHQSVQGRLMNFYYPLLLQGTPYADRLPIGKMDILKTITAADVQRFVETWYTPQALSLVIVGAIDPAVMEGLLKTTFTSTFANANRPAAPRPVSLPAIAQDSADSFRDSELTSNTLLWSKVESVAAQDLRAVKAYELENFLITTALASRFNETAQQADPPFLQADARSEALFGDTFLRQMQVTLREGQTDRSITAFLTELRRLRLFGLTESEFQLALSEFQSQNAASFAQRSSISHTDRASALAAYALTGVPAMDDQSLYALNQDLAAHLSREAVNRHLADWYQLSPARLVLLSVEKAENPAPTPEQVQTLVQQVERLPLIPVQEKVRKLLMPQAPTAGTIVHEETVRGTAIQHWTLSNGLQVYVYPNQFDQGEVRLRALAPGGLNQVDDQNLLSAAFAPSLFSETGLGELTQTELGDFLSGKQANVVLQLDENSASVNATAVPADLETLFQLVHRRLTAPRRDPAAESAFLRQIEDSIRNRQNLPQQLYSNEIQKLLTNGNQRSRPFTVERLAEIVPDRAAEFYQQFFAGGRGLTFVISGDVSEAALRPLVVTYLASLAGGPSAGIRDRGLRPTPGPVQSMVRQGQDDKAVVTVLLPQALPYSATTVYESWVLKEVLAIRLREVLRQDKEGTYGVNSDISLTPYPYARAQTQINFTCDKARQDELIAALQAELAALGRGVISDEVYLKALEIQKRALESNLKTNAWWTWILASSLFRGDALEAVPQLPEFYRQLTKDRIVQLAQRLLSPVGALTIVLNPAPKP